MSRIQKPAPRQTKQATLDGIFLPALPRVRTTDGHMVEWDRERIVRQMVEETRLIEVFYGHESVTEEVAREIAALVEQRILKLGLQMLSGPLIREITNIVLLEQGLVEYPERLYKGGDAGLRCPPHRRRPRFRGP